jgi:hypothetical protein
VDLRLVKGPPHGGLPVHGADLRDRLYLFGAVLLGEPLSAKALAGVALVLLGLFFIATA